MSQAVGADPWDESMGCRICKTQTVELVEYQSNWPGGDIRREDIRMPELPVLISSDQGESKRTEGLHSSLVFPNGSQILLSGIESDEYKSEEYDSIYDLSDMD